MPLNSVLKSASDVASWKLPALLDHCQTIRDDGSFIEHWGTDNARLVRVDAANRVELPLGSQPSVADNPESAVFVGAAEGKYWFAIRGSVANGVALRDADLSDAQLQIVTASIAILNWWDSASFCPVCGGKNVPQNGGFQGKCETCGKEQFPRTDPAIIVAILDEKDRIFLAHNTGWKQNRVSILAGFVEAGESAEQACYREIEEESNLRIQELQFFGSQPWPYPRSLMLGFFARVSSHQAKQARVDGKELDWAGFYSREKALELAEKGELILPTRVSIASKMLRTWLTEPQLFS